MRFQTTHMLVSLLVIVPGLARTGAGSEVSFVPLGAFPDGPYSHSVADDISADGSVVVGISRGAAGLEAFRWTEADGMIGLGDLPGGSYFSDAAAVSADGLTVVGRSNSWNANDGYHEAFRWTGGAMQALGDFAGYPFGSWAADVSADGSVVVGAGYPGRIGAPKYEAFRWTARTGLVSLGGLLPYDSAYSKAFAVSDDGSVVVGWSESESGYEAFRWTEEDGMIGLGDLPGGDFCGAATAVSSDGTVVVGESVVGIDPDGRELREAFRWTEEDGMVGLGFYGDIDAVSADGSVIVGDDGNVPYVWDEVYGQRNLEDILTAGGVDLSGWTLWRAHGVSADGQTITGCAYNSDGNLEAYVAHIPEPTTAWLLTAATLLALRRRRGSAQPRTDTC